MCLPSERRWQTLNSVLTSHNKIIWRPTRVFTFFPQQEEQLHFESETLIILQIINEMYFQIIIWPLKKTVRRCSVQKIFQ